MKTFRLIGMALVAVLVCLNFSSCSGDDEEEVSNKSLKEMLIGQWEQFHSDGTYDDVFIFDKNSIKWYEDYDSPKLVTTYSPYTIDEETKIITGRDTYDGSTHNFLVMEISDTKMTLCVDGDGSDPEYLTKVK